MHKTGYLNLPTLALVLTLEASAGQSEVVLVEDPVDVNET